MARVKGHLRIKKRYQTGIKSHRQVPTKAQECTCQCPRCLTLETLWFRDGILVPTIKFSQGESSRIYHDCNGISAGPCRLFPSWEVNQVKH